MANLLTPYLGPVGSAAAAFPLVALLLFIPAAVWHYRRHGHWHPWRAFVLWSFVFFVLVAAFLVSLPLPDRPAPDDVEAWKLDHQATAHPVLDPWQFAREIADARPGVHQARAWAQALFNGVLLLPWGFFAVYLFRWGVLRATLSGLAVSGLFELSQGTGLFGWYPAPYRLFDTGDLVLNTSGALVGAVLATLLLRWKWLAPLDTLAAPNTPWVGPTRRAVSFLLDAAVVATTSLVGLAACALWLPNASAPGVLAGSVALWLVLVPVLDAGRGPGRRLTLSALGVRATKPAPGRVLVRQTLVWGTVALGLALPAPEIGLLLVALGTLVGLANAFTGARHPEKAGILDRRLGLRTWNTWKPPKKPRAKAS